MTIKKEIKLTEFEFWSGARSFAEKLTFKELDQLESCIEDLYEDTPSETEINDLFWFEEDMLCEWIGLDTEDVYNR